MICWWFTFVRFTTDENVMLTPPHIRTPWGLLLGLAIFQRYPRRKLFEIRLGFSGVSKGFEENFLSFMVINKN
jgi:hypothetical protein